MQDRGATYELWLPTRSRLSRARERAPLRWLSLGRCRNTQSCRTRTPCRAGFDRRTSYERALHRRKTSLLRCKTVVRRSSCGFHHAAGCRVLRERAPLRWLSLGRWRNTQSCRTRTPCRAGFDRRTSYERALHRRETSLLRCKTVVRRASCGLHHAAGCRVHANERHCAGCLSGGVETRKLAARARRAALALVGVRAMKGHCTGGRPLSFGARPWCDVRAVASITQPAVACYANERHCAGCLSGGVETRNLAARARRAALALIGVRAMKGHCTGGRPLSFGARPWCDVRAVASITQPAVACYANERHCAGCLSGGGETRELAARARRAALAVIGLRAMKGHCTGGRPLSFGARPWCDVRAVASNAQPAFACTRRAPLRWLSLGRWRNTQACRARAPCRAGCDRRTSYERALHRRKTSLLRCKTVVRRASCGFHHAAGCRVHANERHCAGCLSGGGETRKLAARARRAALAVIGVRAMKGHCTGGRPLSFGARPWCDVRAVASITQPAVACYANERHCAGCLSGGGETRKLAARARRAALA